MENFEGERFAAQAEAKEVEIKHPKTLELLKYFKENFLQEEGK
jgi:hypothetical protein